jgi:hypothetical protein
MPAAPADKRAPTAADPRIQEETGKLELATALAFLNGENGKRDASKAAQHLWAAVKNGNSEAAVLLADLYVTGDGVEKSCQQGLVLLKSAIKNGNATAKAKLDDLNANGCQ